MTVDTSYCYYTNTSEFCQPSTTTNLPFNITQGEGEKAVNTTPLSSEIDNLKFSLVFRESVNGECCVRVPVSGTRVLTTDTQKITIIHGY